MVIICVCECAILRGSLRSYIAALQLIRRRHLAPVPGEPCQQVDTARLLVRAEVYLLWYDNLVTFIPLVPPDVGKAGARTGCLVRCSEGVRLVRLPFLWLLFSYII